MNIFPDSVYVVKPALHLTGEIWLGIKMYKCLARRTGMWPSHMDAFHLNGGGRSREWETEGQCQGGAEGQDAQTGNRVRGSWGTLDAHVHAKSLQSCLTLCDPMDGSPPGSSVHGVLRARILEWVAIPFSRGSSRPRDWTRVSYVSCIGRWVLYH